MQITLSLIFVVAAAWAVYSDVRERRLPNRLTFGAAAAALVVRLALGGAPALISGAEGWGAGVALLMIPFALGWMGAGDVKLLAAFGAIGGVTFAVETALLGCIVGSAMAVFALFREGKLWFVLRHLAIYVRHPLGTVLETPRRMPFGPALACGAAVSIVLTHGLL